MKKLLYISLIAISVVSCSREVSQKAKAIHTYHHFTASIENDSFSKAMIGSGGAVSWNENDNIIVFGDNKDTYFFQWDGNGAFRGDDVSGSSFSAFYPTNFNLEDNLLVLRGSWPTPFEADKQAWGSIPMVATSVDNHLYFKQTLGLIHFRITASVTNGGCNCITLRGNNDEVLSGEGYIDLSEETPVYRVFSQDAATSTSLILAANEPFDLTNGLDVFFPLPEIVLANGFTVSFEVKNLNTWVTEKEVTKSTSKRVDIKRGKMLTYTVDAAGLLADDNDQTEKERQALIDLYDALDGPHWDNNANWCSEEPIGTWFGVSADNNGHVVALDIRNNGLNGTIPDSFSNLQNLKSLWMEQDKGVVKGFEKAFLLNDLEFLIIGNSVDPGRYNENLFFEIPQNVGNLKKLHTLAMYGVKGTIPEELYTLASLENLSIRCCSVTAPLSSSIGGLSKLTSIDLLGYGDQNAFSGPIPDGLYELTSIEHIQIQHTGISGTISPKIGNLTKLEHLDLSDNKLTGSIPAELSRLPDNLRWLAFMSNDLSGQIPSELAGWLPWDRFWACILEGNDLDYTSARPHIIPFDITTTSGSHYTSDMVRQNEMTVLYSWSSTIPLSTAYMATMKELYNTYYSKGFDCLGWSLFDDAQTVKNFVTNENLPWPNFKAENGNKFLDDSLTSFPDTYPDFKTSSITAFNKDGELIFTEVIRPRDDFHGFVREWFGDTPSETYESSDYSADGTVHVLQTASEGAGIDVVLMGDAYSDRLIADGTYADVMNRTMEAFFAEEPYKSYRNLFNVSYVDVVSKNENYQGQTALGTWYGEGTSVGGDDAKVLQYAKKVLDPAGRSTDEVLVVVLMNRDYRAGTCYMTGRPEGDYGCGYGIAYVPVHSDAEEFGTTVRHEAGGHGFAKLADEYSYGGTIPQEELESYRGVAVYGWWRNVDFTSDPTAVKWADFISDSRYSGEGIGVFEGACTYSYGAYRPTENSIMLNSNWGFNAPSRYAIWYRINKLAYGSSWTGTREDFVAWDKAHPNPAHAPKRLSKASAAKGAAPLPPLGKPVFRFER